ncbi:hypothetical protein RFI_13956, partial [Reticulomyxa filosa]
MDWFDSKKIQRFRSLLERLFKTSSNGIKEHELLSIWDGRKAREIICELRFGVYSDLTHVHIDRFGRRFYTYKYKQGEQRSIFSSDLSVLGDIDVTELNYFLEGVDEQNNASIHQYNSTKESSMSLRLNAVVETNPDEEEEEEQEEEQGNAEEGDNEEDEDRDDNEEEEEEEEEEKEKEKEKERERNDRHARKGDNEKKAMENATSNTMTKDKGNEEKTAQVQIPVGMEMGTGRRASETEDDEQLVLGMRTEDDEGESKKARDKDEEDTEMTLTVREKRDSENEEKLFDYEADLLHLDKAVTSMKAMIEDSNDKSNEIITVMTTTTITKTSSVECLQRAGEKKKEKEKEKEKMNGNDHRITPASAQDHQLSIASLSKEKKKKKRKITLKKKIRSRKKKKKGLPIHRNLERFITPIPRPRYPHSRWRRLLLKTIKSNEAENNSDNDGHNWWLYRWPGLNSNAGKDFLEEKRDEMTKKNQYYRSIVNGALHGHDGPLVTKKLGPREIGKNHYPLPFWEKDTSPKSKTTSQNIVSSDSLLTSQKYYKPIDNAKSSQQY